MILMRDTTPGIMRRGTVVDSDTTPSTRKRTRISRSSVSKWMSEAPRCTASAMIEWTSLMTGASSADSRRSLTSIVSGSSAAASETASSIRFSWLISASMSSCEVTARRTSSPVIMAMSSIARMFAGSAIATSTVRSSR